MIEILLFITILFLGFGVLLYAKINIKNKTINYIYNFIFSKSIISIIIFFIISWGYSYLKYNDHRMFFLSDNEIIIIYNFIILIIFCTYFKFESLLDIPLLGAFFLIIYLKTEYSILLFLITLIIGNFGYIYITKTKYKKINIIYNIILGFLILCVLALTYHFEKNLIKEKKYFYNFKKNLKNEYISYNLKKNKKNEYISNFYKMKFDGDINLIDSIDLNYRNGVLIDYTINYENDFSIYYLFNLLKDKEISNFKDVENFLKNLKEENWFKSIKNLPYKNYRYEYYDMLNLTKEQFLLFEKLNKLNKWSDKIRNKNFLIFSLKISIYNELKKTNQDLTEIRQDINNYMFELNQ
ncbi:MAG: hypothetical protein RSB50_09255 [Cetobacterium sp.]